MSAVYRDSNWIASRPMKSEDIWEPTPKWHWRYWFGFTWRLEVSGSMYSWDPEWKYQTDYQRAMQVLEEQCQ